MLYLLVKAHWWLSQRFRFSYIFHMVVSIILFRYKKLRNLTPLIIDFWGCSGVVWGFFGARSGVVRGSFGGRLGILWASFGDRLGIVWGSFGGRFGVVLGVVWGSLWGRLDGHFRVIKGVRIKHITKDKLQKKAEPIFHQLFRLIFNRRHGWRPLLGSGASLGGIDRDQTGWNSCSESISNAYSIYLINHAGILENLGSNMGQKSVLNQLFKPCGALGSVRNGFAEYFSCRLSPSMLRMASKWSQYPFVSP